jgi:hypothetical protein
MAQPTQTTQNGPAPDPYLAAKAKARAALLEEKRAKRDHLQALAAASRRNWIAKPA